MSKTKRAILGMVVVLALVAFVPAPSTAGSLEPSAAPSPTMRTLDQLPPAWSQKLAAEQRFELALGGAAWLDKETGLVWSSGASGNMNWTNAFFHCAMYHIQDRGGWHLPTVEQLQSLMGGRENLMPAGHPFYLPLGPYTGTFWTMNTNSSDPTQAWASTLNGGLTSHSKADTIAYVWCVRGGQSNDGQ